MPETLATLEWVLDEGARRLAAAGIAEPRREASVIWAELAGRTPGEAILEGRRPLRTGESERLDAAFARRAAGEPLAYVTGRAGFRHLDLAVDARVLIPRPETEGLVEGVLARVRRGTAVDVGTGSGCIALSLAGEGEFQRVVGIDRSAAALAVARSNRAAAGLEVGLIQGDLVSCLAPGSADAIVSNPPYLSEPEYAALGSSVRDWEPMAALVSGPDGLAATRALLNDSRRVLRPGGWIALEVDCTRAGAAARHALTLGWTDVAVEADLFGRERYLFARRSARS
ncbi:MAG: peptide chain release factor N(5)-glutamine methyltransferase [Bacillota bacterium]|jgi:release factor glutamine methyltransferase